MTPSGISRHQHVPLGVFYGCLAAFSFALMTVFAKKIGHSLPTATLLFFRFLISFILLLPWIIRSSQFTFKVQEPLRYGMRVITSFLSIFCIFYAIKFIPLVDGLLLNNTTPLFIPIVVLLMTGVKTSRQACSGIVLGFIGIAVFLNPGYEIFSLASFLALAAGLFAALSIVQIRMMSKKNLTSQILFYYFLGGTLISGVLLIFQWQTPSHWMTWLVLLGIGIFGALYQLFSTLSYAVAPVRYMSPLLFLTVIFGGIFDWMLWGYKPDIYAISGGLLVVAGSLITVYSGHREISQSKS